MPQPTIKYAGHTLRYYDSYTYESNQADEMMKDLRNKGHICACTHSGGNCHLYINVITNNL